MPTLVKFTTKSFKYVGTCGLALVAHPHMLVQATSER